MIILTIVNNLEFAVLSSYALPNEAIEPAANASIEEHGADALFAASRQVSALNSKGLYSLAAIWQQIRHKLIERQQLDELQITSK